MAGIYIHIPFCKQICHYCDFYKIANPRLHSQFINSVVKEIETREHSLTETIDTIYFGGGTPSSLSIENLHIILETLHKYFLINRNAEITIEINPDDVSKEFLSSIKEMGFNRLSIGIQSFNDKILKYLNRKHTADSAINSVVEATNSGFNNISVDLIYGIPEQTIENFDFDLKIVFDLNVSHLSAYHLGIEPGTYFGKLKQHNKLKEIDEDDSNAFFEKLTNWAKINNFEHYEISNLAKNGQYSKHNMSYWFQTPYLGLGPSAHSFYDNKRFFNVSNLNKYINQIDSGDSFFSFEILSKQNMFNEYVMLGLRTKWGISLNKVHVTFGKEYLDHLLRRIDKFKDTLYLRIVDEHVYLTEKGLFSSDYIVRELFIV